MMGGEETLYEHFEKKYAVKFCSSFLMLFSSFD